MGRIDKVPRQWEVRCGSDNSGIRTVMVQIFRDALNKRMDGTLKVGFLSQPFDYAGPPDPGSSLGIWTWETARRLVRSCQVLIVASRVRGGPAIEKWEGVHFRRFAL